MWTHRQLFLERSSPLVTMILFSKLLSVTFMKHRFDHVILLLKIFHQPLRTFRIKSEISDNSHRAFPVWPRPLLNLFCFPLQVTRALESHMCSCETLCFNEFSVPEGTADPTGDFVDYINLAKLDKIMSWQLQVKSWATQWCPSIYFLDNNLCTSKVLLPKYKLIQAALIEIGYGVLKIETVLEKAWHMCSQIDCEI